MKLAVCGFVLVALCGAAIVRTTGREVLNSTAPAQDDGGRQEPPRTIAAGEAPGQWVPFSGRITQVFDPGNVFVGTLYRASDGSTRSETGRSRGEITIISIKNMAEKLFYQWHVNTGWESHPMDLPGGKYIQPRPNGAFADRPIVDQIDGLGVIAMPPQSSGVVQYLAPQLNYFAVRTVERCSTSQEMGCGFQLSEIRVGDQPPDLFKPPAAEQVEIRSEPGGVTRGSPARPK
jgi:hypothetical protein